MCVVCTCVRVCTFVGVGVGVSRVCALCLGVQFFENDLFVLCLADFLIAEDERCAHSMARWPRNTDLSFTLHPAHAFESC